MTENTDGRNDAADPFSLGNVIRAALPDDMRLHGLSVDIARAVLAAGYRRVVSPAGTEGDA